MTVLRPYTERNLSSMLMGLDLGRTSYLIRAISPHISIVNISDLRLLGSSEREGSLSAADIEGAGDDGNDGFWRRDRGHCCEFRSWKGAIIGCVIAWLNGLVRNGYKKRTKMSNMFLGLLMAFESWAKMHGNVSMDLEVGRDALMKQRLDNIHSSRVLSSIDLLQVF